MTQVPSDGLLSLQTLLKTHTQEVFLPESKFSKTSLLLTFIINGSKLSCYRKLVYSVLFGICRFTKRISFD